MIKDTRKLSELLKARCSPKEYNRIKGLARKYARGSISAWLIYQGINGQRKYLKQKDFPDSIRRGLE